MKRSIVIGMGCLFTTALLVSAGVAVHAEEGATVSAMQIVYSREVNARIQYLAYAERAEQEAQPTVACLFRSLAQAESIHAARHATAIEQLEAKPLYQYEDVLVLRTEQNLKTSILGEMQERGYIYPRLSDYAREECRYDALASCVNARGAEATHERVLRAALLRLEREQAEMGEQMIASLEPIVLPTLPVAAPTYYLCTGDGCVYTSAFKRCPSCGTAGDQALTRECGR